MIQRKRCQVLVVGGGPGGYVAAIRAGQLELETILVEADRVGGTCLIRGCIPSKALIHAASRYEALKMHYDAASMGISIEAPPVLSMPALIEWKESIVQQLNSGVRGLLKRAKVTCVHGWAQFSDAKHCRVSTAEGDIEITAEHVILANGSTEVELPSLPFGDSVISSTQALSLTTLPKKMVVVGAGYIGLELGTVFHKLGSQVTFIEAAEQVLPQFDSDLVKPLKQWVKRQGIDIHLNAKATHYDEQAGVLHYEMDGALHELAADTVLIAVGRRPNVTGWGADSMGLTYDDAFIAVDDQCRTAMKNVWAIGDIVGEPMLAHKASFQGEMVAELIAGHRRRFDPVAIPSVCFTEPEIVTVGLSAEAAKAQQIDTVSGRFPFAANGRALSMQAGAEGGFVQIIARADNHVVLGIHATGAHVSELVGEFTLALEMGARLEDLLGTIHAHPSLGEALPEAAMHSLGRAIHA